MWNRNRLFIPFLALFIVFSGRFFLTPEFLLYPYFSSLGTIPYKGLIDQHLPGIFFGPVSMSSIPYLGYHATLLLFAILIILFGVSVDRNTKNNKGYMSGLTLLGVGYLLELQHLWIEFVVVIGVWLALKIYKRSEFISGFAMSALIISRPFFVGYWIYVLITKKSANFFWGSLMFGFTVLSWFYLNGNFTEFIDLLIFNTHEYSKLAQQFPNNSQILISILCIGISMYYSKTKIWIPLLLSSLSAYPRFEMHHLFGVILGPILAFEDKRLENKGLNLLLLISVSSLLLLKWWPTRLAGDFFNNKETQKITQEFKDIGNNTGYILGGPDSVYFLGNTKPCDNYYLPSLPWYHSNNEYVSRQIEALERCQNETVLVNKNSMIDGELLIETNSRIYEHVIRNYKMVKKVGDYEFYVDQK